MFKAIQRKAQKKQNFEIQLKIVRVSSVIVKRDLQLQLFWKRGPQQDKTNIFDLNELEVDATLNEVFSKVSSFYTKDEGATYEKKTGSLILKEISKNGETVIAQKEVDMSYLVNKVDHPESIELENFTSDLIDITVEVEWTITEASQAKGRASVASLNTVLGLNQMQGAFT